MLRRAASYSAARRAGRGCGALLLGLLLARPLAAQPSVELSIEQEQIYANEPFLVQIRVTDFAQCQAPVFPEIPGCLVRPLGAGADSSQVVIINGRIEQSRTRSYQFELTARQPGELIIPPVRVTVDGTTLRTRPTRLRVRPGNVGDLLWAEITCAHDRLYVGQQARFKLTIGVKPVEVGGTRLSERAMRRFFEGSNFGPFPAQAVTIAEQRRRTADGSRQLYYTYELSSEQVVDRPGPLAFDQVVIGMNYPTGFARDVFYELTPTSFRRLRVRPRVPNIRVLPLPAAGRPATFTGAVGRFSLAASAKPTSVRVGDPIELTIEIAGEGPLETLPPPDLRRQPALLASFRVPPETLAGEVVGGRKRFKQIIRAKRPELSAIPALEYAYFDPQRRRYAVARSAPIPIAVAAAEALSPQDLGAISTARRGSSAGGLEPLPGLRGIETSEAALLARVRPPGPAQVLTALLAPATAFGLFWAVTLIQQARSGQRAGRRRRAALKHARQALAAARTLPLRDAAQTIQTALARYLAERVNQPAARFNGRSAIDFLRRCQVAPPLRERCAALLERCERASYGGLAEGDAQSLAREARECLSRLARERL